MQSQTVEIQYFPHRGQEPFHNDRYKILHRAIIAATGSGKTEAGVFEDISWCIENPGIIGYAFEPNYPMVKRNLIPKIEQFLGTPIESSPLIRQFNRTDLRIEFISELGNSTLWLGSLDNAESIEGSSIDFVHVDEARLVPDLETAIKVIQRRLRGSGGGHPIGAWWTTTPDHPGSTLHKFFEDPKTLNPLSKIYRMSLFDNQDNLPDQYIKEVVAAHTGFLAERFIYGRFSFVGGGDLGFDGAKNVYPNAALGEVEPPYRMLYGVDWGWTNPTAILGGTVDNDGRVYIMDEVYSKNMSDEDIAQALREMQVRRGPGPVYCGHDEPKSIDKLRLQGINAMIRLSPRIEDGVREMGGRFTVAGDGRPRLFIHRGCVNLISELQIYSDETQRKGILHATDALRYLLSPLILSSRKSLLTVEAMHR
jgi:hypothetical protein